MANISERDGQIRRAYELHNSGQLDDALLAVDAGIVQDPNSYWGHGIRSLILKDLGRLDECLVEIEHALKLTDLARLDSDLAEKALMYAVFLYLELGGLCWRVALKTRRRDDWQKALGAYQGALDLDSRSAYAWHGLGESTRRLGNRTDAIKAFDTAVSIDPNLVDAHISLFQCHMLGLNFRAAFRAYVNSRKLLLEKLS